MPKFMQWLSNIIPAKYFIRALRGIMLKGESWLPLEGGVMILMAVLLLTLATRRFKGRLE